MGAPISVSGVPFTITGFAKPRRFPAIAYLSHEQGSGTLECTSTEALKAWAWAFGRNWNSVFPNLFRVNVANPTGDVYEQYRANEDPRHTRLDGVWMRSGFCLEMRDATSIEWDAVYALMDTSARPLEPHPDPKTYDALDILRISAPVLPTRLTDRTAMKAIRASETFYDGALRSVVASVIAKWPHDSLSRETRVWCALTR